MDQEIICHCSTLCREVAQKYHETYRAAETSFSESQSTEEHLNVGHLFYAGMNFRTRDRKSRETNIALFIFKYKLT
jgi:hypothetical protein